MTPRSIFALVLLLSLLSACGSTNTFIPHQQSTPLSIDGSLSDWNTNQSLFESRDGANYYASFDEDFIYLFIDIKSPFKDRAIRQSGFTVYLSDNEDQRNRIGVGFPAGSFNLLRENPGAFNSMTRDTDWFTKPENLETLERLNENLFSRVMIVERFDGSSNPEYGFVDKSQLQVDGIEIAADTHSRILSIEMKIPRNGSSIFEFSKQRLWLGFAIEPPNFRQQSESTYSSSHNDRNMQGNPQQRAPRQNTARIFGAMERWYNLDMSK
jgi:hypothetical protein